MERRLGSKSGVDEHWMLWILNTYSQDCKKPMDFFEKQQQKNQVFFGLNHISLLSTNKTFVFPKTVETNSENPKTL